VAAGGVLQLELSPVADDVGYGLGVSRAARVVLSEPRDDLPVGGGTPLAGFVDGLLGTTAQSLESLSGAHQDELLDLHGFGPRAARILNEAHHGSAPAANTLRSKTVPVVGSAYGRQ